VPNKRGNGYEQYNVAGVIIKRHDDNNTYRVLTPFGLIKHRLKHEQFIPINNTAYKTDLDPLKSQWDTPEALDNTLKHATTISIMQAAQAMLTSERVARDARMREIMRQRVVPPAPAKRGRRKASTALPSLPATRRNAILAASVPDSDNRYEPGAVLCIPEFILGERFVDDEKSYKITWLNLDDSFCTWELANVYDTNPAYQLLIDNWNTYKQEQSYVVRHFKSKANKAKRTQPDTTATSSQPAPKRQRRSKA
jgi:hypothetical protein